MDSGLIVLFIYLTGLAIWCVGCGVEDTEESMIWGFMWPMMPCVLIPVGAGYCFFWLGKKIRGSYVRHTKRNT